MYDSFYLNRLESESICIIREVMAEGKNPVLLFSGGKDSIVLTHLAKKAFFPDKIPFSLLHIDTGHNFEEVIDFRNDYILNGNIKLIIKYVDDSIKKGTVRLKTPNASRNQAQSITLLETISEFKYDICIGGARRDEEKSRAKERIFSFRDKYGQWDPKSQRPELWNIYNTRINNDENIRVFPISDWTEIDIWQYIKREKLLLPSIYFTHERYVRPYGRFLICDNSSNSYKANVRFRTVGDKTCTSPIISEAKNLEDVIKEITNSKITERGSSRMDDLISESAMEQRKKEGYF